MSEQNVELVRGLDDIIARGEIAQLFDTAREA